MADTEVVPSSWKSVQVGRVVIFSNETEYANRIAVIVEIIDPNRVLVEGPSEVKGASIPRQQVQLKKVTLTPLHIQIPRAIGPGPLAAKWKASGVDKKYKDSAFAKSRERSSKRKQLNDFDRFKVMRLKKQVRHEVRKSLAKIKSS